ncbi:MAG: amidohydrolase [Spirochaetales bacterium]|nr:amidohydrolase [Spirochaetales bacterium]
MILPEVRSIAPTIIATRRTIHSYPELAFQEHKTAALIAERLKSSGYEPRTGIGQTGVVCDLGPGPYLALRADMDALPLQEQSDVEYRSRVPGIMHACGHDGHVAILLGVAEILAHKKLKRGLRFIFQPAEEGHGGATAMIRDGVLDQVDRIYGLHLWNYQNFGEVGVMSGPVLAATSEFEITIEGQGGHGATPQGTADAVLVAAHVITALQSIVSRNLDPLDSGVVTVGAVSAGSNYNIIAESARLIGTIRSYKDSTHALLCDRLTSVTRSVAAGLGARARIVIKEGYPPTVNHPELAATVEKAARSVGAAVGPPYLTMGGEDFSFYGRHVPSCFFFIGSRPAGREVLSIPHHCSHFDIEEEALLVGASVFLSVLAEEGLL